MTDFEYLSKINGCSVAVTGVRLAVAEMCDCVPPGNDDFDAWASVILGTLKTINDLLDDLEDHSKKRLQEVTCNA